MPTGLTSPTAFGVENVGRLCCSGNEVKSTFRCLPCACDDLLLCKTVATHVLFQRSGLVFMKQDRYLFL